MFIVMALRVSEVAINDVAMFYTSSIRSHDNYVVRDPKSPGAFNS